MIIYTSSVYRTSTLVCYKSKNPPTILLVWCRACCVETLFEQALHTFQRQADTNQRITFDIDPTGRYLATGSTEPRALVYGIESHELLGSLKNQADAVGSVCFHPSTPLLGVCTGQREFGLGSYPETESDSSDRDRDATPGCNNHNARREGLLAQGRNGVTLYGIGQ